MKARTILKRPTTRTHLVYLMLIAVLLLSFLTLGRVSPIRKAFAAPTSWTQYVDPRIASGTDVDETGSEPYQGHMVQKFQRHGCHSV